MMMGIDGRLALSCLQTSRPLILGIITSRMTKSGECFSARSRPSTPSSAVDTSKPSYSKLSRRPATMFGSSSTIRILVVPMNSTLLKFRPNMQNHVAGSQSCGRRARLRQLDGQRNGEFAAALRRTFDKHIPAMGLGDVFHKRETQAGALGVVHQRVAAAVKLFEDFVLFGGGDADAAIANFKLHAPVGAVQADADELLVLGIFQGIVYEIEQGARNRFAVDVYRRNVAGDIFFEGKTVLLDLEAVRLQGAAHQFGQIRLLEVVFLAAGFDAGEIENIVDERAQAFAFFADDAEIFLVFFLGGQAAKFERLRV